MTDSTIRAAQLVKTFEILTRTNGAAARSSKQAAATPAHQGSKRQGDTAGGGGGKRRAAPSGPAAGTRAAVAAAATEGMLPAEPSRRRAAPGAVLQRAPAQPAAQQPARQHPAAHPVAAQYKVQRAAAAANAAIGGPVAPAAAPTRQPPAPPAPTGQAPAPAVAPTRGEEAQLAAPRADGTLDRIIVQPSIQISNATAKLLRHAVDGPGDDPAFKPAPGAVMPPAVARSAAAGFPLLAQQQQFQQQQGREQVQQQQVQQQQVQLQQLQQQQQGHEQAQQERQQQGQQGQQQQARPAPAVLLPALPVEALDPADVLLQLAAAVDDPAARQAGLDFATLDLAVVLFDWIPEQLTGRVRCGHGCGRLGAYWRARFPVHVRRPVLQTGRAVARLAHLPSSRSQSVHRLPSSRSL